MNFNIDAKVMGEYDVIVCGGGTAGVMAAVSAAKNGAKTLMIERGAIPGGMITTGNAGITKSLVHTHDVKKYKEGVLDMLSKDPGSVQVVGGLTKEFLDRLISTGAGIGTHGQPGSYVFTALYPAVWNLMETLDEAGIDTLYMTNICGTVCENGRVNGVVVFNKSGFGIYNGKVIIDTTGDADVSAFSGAEYVLGAGSGDLKEFENVVLGSMMGFGTMFRVDNVDMEELFEYLTQNSDKFHLHEFGVMDLDNIKKSYRNGEMVVFRFYHGENNSEIMQVYNTPIKNQVILLTGIHRKGTDGLNTEYVSKCIHELHGIVRGKFERIKAEVPGFKNMEMNNIPEIGIRETRHIVGVVKLMAEDIVKNRQWEDSIGRGGHPVDISGVSKELNVNNVQEKWSFGIPYRCLVPENINGLLVAGRCVSASRVASGAIRPTVQCMIMGEAAGAAAAICVKNGTEPRDIDIKVLQAALKAQGAVL